MNKYSIYCLLLSMLTTAVVSAQDLNEAKKAINDEQYDKAKSILKTLVKTKPNDGKNFYYLGDLFLLEGQVDSSKYYFTKGLAAKDKGTLNYIGLGQIALESKNVKEAKINFDKAEKGIKKRDYDELLLIAKANIHNSNPNPKEAIIIANKVIEKDSKNAEAYLVLGDAYLLEKKQNEAYSAYRDAYEYDNTLIKAKLQLSVITKRARAYKNAIEGFQEVVQIDPNYAPTYREIAETYLLMAKNSNSNSKEYLDKAAENYKKYMVLSEGSVDSKLKYADLLLYTKDYVELEKVTKELKDKGNVNPRAYRYLGYAAYENGNYKESIEALLTFLDKADGNKVIGRDYLFLGLAHMAQAKDKDGKIEDYNIYDKGIKFLKVAVEVEPAIAVEFNDHGLKLFKEKKYLEASKIFEISANVQNQSNYMYDNYYLGYSLYFLGKDEPNVEILQQASDAFTKTIIASPSIKEAYLFKARSNRYIDTGDSRAEMTEAYLGYIKALEAKNELNKDENKNNLIEAYTYIGTHYANIEENDKAIEYLNKVLELDSTNSYAAGTIKALKK